MFFTNTIFNIGFTCISCFCGLGNKLFIETELLLIWFQRILLSEKFCKVDRVRTGVLGNENVLLVYNIILSALTALVCRHCDRDRQEEVRRDSILNLCVLSTFQNRLHRSSKCCPCSLDGNTLPRKSNVELRMVYDIKHMHVSVLVSLCVLTPGTEELRTGTFGKP